MRKPLFVLNVILIIILVSCSQSSKDIVGAWTGKTSQDYDIALKVEMENGNPIVSELYFKKILIRVDANTVIESQAIPIKMKANIKNGKFNYSGDDWTISGSFKGETSKGNINTTYNNPQDGKKIKSNVTFALTKADSL